MASKTIIVDDMDGKTRAAETVNFAVNGTAYEIDLSGKNATEFKNALEPFVKAAREVKAANKPNESDAPEIRKWALENGFEVPERGRIPHNVRDAYYGRDEK